MNTDNSLNSDIFDLLRNFDLSYIFKRKRLKYMKNASVNEEILSLKNSFLDLWEKDGDRYKLKEVNLKKESLNILKGVLGNFEEADAFLDINRAMLKINRGQFQKFLNEKISSSTARKNFDRILFGNGESIINLIGRQVPYLERFIPTMKKIDTALEKSAPVIVNSEDIENIELFIKNFDDIVVNISKDINLYRRFIKDFRRLYRKGRSLNIVGYGEISTVMTLSKAQWLDENYQFEDNEESEWIWKKMPPFPDMDEVVKYEKLYADYRKILNDNIGIRIPRQAIRHFSHDTYYIIYAGQERLDSAFICNNLIKKLDGKNATVLLKKILSKIIAVHTFNTSDSSIIIGFDAQLSNWIIDSHEKDVSKISEKDDLYYIDTSSPLIRENGKEQLNPEVFIKSAASFLRPIIRKFFLQEVLDRYYDMRSVAIDLVANLHKEKRQDLIDLFIEVINDVFIENQVMEDVITRKEIDKYYSSDAFIWKFYQASRKIDRFITEKILRKKYLFRIPGKIKR